MKQKALEYPEKRKKLWRHNKRVSCFAASEQNRDVILFEHRKNISKLHLCNVRDMSGVKIRDNVFTIFASFKTKYIAFYFRFGRGRSGSHVVPGAF